MNNPLTCLYPEWPKPDKVRAYVTTRAGGVSLPPYDTLNLGSHVGDELEWVAENRRRLKAAIGLRGDLHWLEQVHGTEVIELGSANQPGCRGDAACTGQSGQACVVMTADCLPVLFCDRAGTWVAAAHAGWRGLVDGILEQTVARYPGQPEELLAWLGPAIGPKVYQVDDGVRARFIARDRRAADAFTADGPGHWLMDLYQLARQRLVQAGVGAVYGGDHCTYSEPQRFYSFRRDGVTGRMAALIWLAADD